MRNGARKIHDGRRRNIITQEDSRQTNKQRAAKWGQNRRNGPPQTAVRMWGKAGRKTMIIEIRNMRKGGNRKNSSGNQINQNRQRLTWEKDTGSRPRRLRICRRTNPRGARSELELCERLGISDLVAESRFLIGAGRGETTT